MAYVHNRYFAVYCTLVSGAQNIIQENIDNNMKQIKNILINQAIFLIILTYFLYTMSILMCKLIKINVALIPDYNGILKKKEIL